MLYVLRSSFYYDIYATACSNYWYSVKYASGVWVSSIHHQSDVPI